LARKALATKVDKRVTLIAKYGGMHLPKGGSFIGRTLLFTDVKEYPNMNLVTQHMWSQTNEFMQYELLKKGDTVKIIGTVIKYYKYSKSKPEKDFSVNIISVEKVEGD
jgi:hypothetical protein